MVCDFREKVQSVGVAKGTLVTFDVNYLTQFLAVGTDTFVLSALAGETTGLKWIPNRSYVKVSEVQAQNTQGGTFTQGAWQTRVLNTEDSDVDGVCALAANQITLTAGTYECRIIAPAFQVQRHQARLYNVTDGALLVLGTSQYSGVSGSSDPTSGSVVAGKFTIAASKKIEVQHYCQVTYATVGFGCAANITNEVYTIAEFWRVG